jgi:hypothetical protein
MRRFILLLTTIIVAACTDVYVEPTPIADNALTLNVSIEESSDTRIQLDEAGKTVWNSGDYLSVYYLNSFSKWRFNGNDGDRTGTITPDGSVGNKVPVMTNVVAVYPYGDYAYSPTTKMLTATLSAEQSYIDGSYGENGNMLVAYSTNGNLQFKNVYGWLKLQLKGDNQRIKSIVVKGNNYEQIVGDVEINVNTLETSLTSYGMQVVKLDCGDEGVALSEKATSFYIGLMPQTFEKGISVEIETMDGEKMTKTTTKRVVIERNTIQPMATLEFAKDIFFPANNEFWYFGYQTTPASATPFYGVNIVREDIREYCADMTCKIFYALVCDGEITKINSQAFVKNEDMTSIYIPHSVTSIGTSAFYGCSVTEVHIGDGIESIGMGAFTNCVRLESLYLHATTPPSLGDYALMSDATGAYNYIGCTIYVPREYVEAYKSHSSWSKYKDYIKPFDYVANEDVNDDETSSFGFNHRLLLVDHTGVNCGYCPEMIDRLLALSKSEYADYYYDVQVHGGWYASGDPAYSNAANVVDRYYKPGSYPALMLNFSSNTINRGNSDNTFVNSTMSAIFNSSRKKFGADAGVAVATKMSASTITIDADVKADETQEYHITAWVLENNISSPDQNGATQAYHKVYNHALRYIAGAYSANDISGDSLGVIEKGSVATKRYTVNIDSAWNPLNLEVLVIVSAKNANGKFEVVNCAKCPMNATRDYEYISANNDEKEVVLSVNTKRIKANGSDKATFTVKYGDDDVTADAQIYNVATSELLSGHSFSTTTVGTYEFTARYNGYSATSTISVEAYSPEPAAKPEVGAIYEVNGVQGVIYAINTNKATGITHCYLFSMDEEDLQWSTLYEWCNCISGNGFYNSYDPFDRYGCNVNNYPAFKWCFDHGEGWFMPSSKELYQIWDFITDGARDFEAPSVAKWNKLITDNGGEPFCETYYWSSNETSEDLVEVIAFMDDSVICLDPKKDNIYTTRAVYRFVVE